MTRIKLALLLASITVAQPGHAQTEPKGTVVVHHRARNATPGGVVKQRGKDSLAFSVPAGVPIKVSVDGSNSALYQCALGTKPLPVGDTDSLRAWLGTLKNYLPLVASALFTAMFQDPTQKASSDSLRNDLQPLFDALAALDLVTVGDFGMTSVQDSLLLGLDTLARIKPGDSVAPTVKHIRAGLSDPTSDVARYRPCPAGGSCTSVSFPAALVRATGKVRLEVREARVRLRDDSTGIKRASDTLAKYQKAVEQAVKDTLAEKDPAKRKVKVEIWKKLDQVPVLTKNLATLEDIRARRQGAIAIGDAAVAEGGKRLDAAYALEKFSRIVLGASDTLKCDLLKVTSDTGRAVTVAIAPRKLTEITRLPVEDSLAVQFSLTPERKVSIGLGLSLVLARRAVYPTFGTAKLGEAQKDTVRVIRNGEKDRRFDYGLTLGLTWGSLDQRDNSNWAIWLPELTVNPADDVRSFGVGIGFSYSVVKLGVGALWVKHDEPDPTTPENSILPNADAFKTVSKLGPPKLYLSFSLIGLPPFLRQK